jgi:hypothetical protein
MKQISILFCTAIVLLSLPYKTTAQKTEPIFEISAGNVVMTPQFLIQASSGELITSNEIKLMAIDPESKSVVWENKDFLGLEEDDISVIDGTPFIKIERQKMLAIGSNKKTYIIRAKDGKVVYDSKEEGIKVRNTLIVKELNGMLLEVVKDGFLSVSFVGFAAGKELWTVPLVKEKTGGIGIGALKRAVKSHYNSAFNIDPIVDASGNLVLVNKKEVFCISLDGKLAWKKEYDDNVDDAYLGSDGKSLFIGYKKYIDKLNTENGNSLLKEPIKMRDELNGLLPVGNDYIVYNEAGINLMDAEGNMKWKKDTKLGNITQVKYTPNGILAIEAVKDDETVFFWVDNNGRNTWDEKVKGGLILAEPTDKGVMYVTTERANVLTYEKGKDVWDKDIKLKGVPNFGMDEENKTLYAYAKDKIHAFNFKDNTYKLVAEDIELKKFDDEKERAELDIRKSGSLLVLSSGQSVVGIQTADGKVNYNNYFKDIGHTKKAWMKVAGIAAGVGAAYLGAKGLYNAGSGAVTGDASKTNKGVKQFNVSEGLDNAGYDTYVAAQKRYIATQATKDNLYILSQMPEGNGLMVWNKDKGEAVKKITFSDITPIYVVDEASDRLYVLVNGKLKAYDLK